MLGGHLDACVRGKGPIPRRSIDYHSSATPVRHTSSKRALVAAGFVAVMTIGAVSPAHATESPDDPSAQELIANATPGAEKAGVVAATTTPGVAEYVAEAPAADTIVSIPVDANAGVTVDGETSAVTVGLPNAGGAEPGVIDEDGLVSTTTTTVQRRCLSFAKTASCRSRR